VIFGRAVASPRAFTVALTVAIALAGCGSAPPRPAPLPKAAAPPAALTPSLPPDSIPDAVPRIEARSRYGNPPFYDVFGKRYYVLSSSVGYWERGVASWYGPGFHKERTSTGEPYDMYGMTAAHKTLPLPAYVRVTNLQNGRSIVVRVNDRGPFVGNRIIDLSYTAAAKLDMLRNGTALVEVRTIDPSTPLPVITASTGAAAPVAIAATAGAPISTAMASTAVATTAPASVVLAPMAPTTSAPSTVPSVSAPVPIAPTIASSPAPGTSTSAPASVAAPTVAPASLAAPSAPSLPNSGAAPGSLPLFVQAGAFSDPANAERLAEKLRGGGYGKVFVRDDQIAGRRMFRVRIGPVPDVAEFDRVVAALERAGINDAHLALD
jgi:rare lipoprotein A